MSDNELKFTIFVVEVLILFGTAGVCLLLIKIDLPRRHILMFLNSGLGLAFGLFVSYIVFEFGRWVGVSDPSLNVSVSASGLVGVQLYRQLVDISGWVGRQ